jgi:hypothetical protein
MFLFSDFTPCVITLLTNLTHKHISQLQKELQNKLLNVRYGLI